MPNSSTRDVGGYRDRVYAHYVSAFKQRPPQGLLESSFERHARFFDHLFAPLLAETRPEKILEVGCGQGRFLFWAQRRGLVNVRGFDRAAEQLAVARSLGLPVEEGSTGEYLLRCDRDFDLIVAMDVIEHFSRDEALQFLEQCRACLRPGGYLFLMTANGAALRPGPVIHGDLTHETIFSPPTLRLALRLAGYEHVTIREIVPPPTSVRSRTRRVLWKLVRLIPIALDLIETGSASGGIYSRGMAVHARRPRAYDGVGNKQ